MNSCLLTGGCGRREGDRHLPGSGSRLLHRGVISEAMRYDITMTLGDKPGFSELIALTNYPAHSQSAIYPRLGLHDAFSLQPVRTPRFSNLKKCLLDSRTFLQASIPTAIKGELGCELVSEVQFIQKPFPNRSPCHKGYICVCAFIADKPTTSISSKTSLNNTENTIDLVRVSIDGCLKSLRMEASEPGRLAEVWTLTYSPY